MSNIKKLFKSLFKQTYIVDCYMHGFMGNKYKVYTVEIKSRPSRACILKKSGERYTEWWWSQSSEQRKKHLGASGYAMRTTVWRLK